MARYDGINFTPPAGVRAALRRGLDLHDQGMSGDGLQPDTVAWARRLADGGAATPEKARKMARFFGRNGRFATAPKDSPAWVSWLLWGGSPGRSWSAKLVRQMDARDAEMTATIRGACVALEAPAQGAESPWNVLAYEVALEGRGDVKLTRADFVQCVANFTRFGNRVPVVLYHADTDAMAHPDARKAHAWIVAMRVGSMTRDGKTVATLEAKFRWVNTATRASVETGELAYGSVTLVQNGVDEESGAEIGSYLWSFSLTNNPALVDIPRIAASAILPRSVRASSYYGDLDDRDDVLEMLRSVLMLPALATEEEVMREVGKLSAMLDAPPEGVDIDDVIGCMRDAMRLPTLTSAADVIAALRKALSAMPAEDSDSAGAMPPMSSGQAPASLSHKGNTMQTIQFLTLAARLGIASGTEDEAQRAVLARAEETLATRRQLGLGADVSAKDVEAKITALAADAARVAVVTAENEALKVREAERSAREVDEHVAALCADPSMSKARVALEGFARADYAAFSKAYPKPAANSAALLGGRITSGTDTAPAADGEESHSDRADREARKLMASNASLSYRDALMMASRTLVEVQ